MTESLYITNYRDNRCPAFQSITRLPRAQAYALAKQLSVNVGESFTSFSRFREADFTGYYEKRLRTERWLHEKFLQNRGEPKSPHPLYFVLNESTYLNAWYENGVITRLPLDSIDPTDVSFTFGDSMSRMDSPDRLDPFTKDSLFALIREQSDDVLSYLQELDSRNRYIEVQLWNDVYIRIPSSGDCAEEGIESF